MKAAVVEQAGHPPIYLDFVDPVAGPDEVVVNVTASALGPLARGGISIRRVAYARANQKP